MTMLTCPKCNAALTEGAVFCAECGTKVDALGQPTAQTVFCSECGVKVEGSSAFCGACGKPVAGVKKPRKTNRIRIAVAGAVALLALLVFMVVSHGGGQHSGTWKGFAVKDGDDKEYADTLVFSGKSFTYTQYYRSRELSHIIDPERYRYVNIIPAPRLSFILDIADMEILSEWSTERDYAVWEHQLLRGTTKGTFSITDGKIEFVLSDGTVRVCAFERTENTVKIDLVEFTRAGKKRS